MILRSCLITFLTLLVGSTGQAQILVKGILADHISKTPLTMVEVDINNQKGEIQTDETGFFRIESHEEGPFIIYCRLEGYHLLKIPVSSNPESSTVDLGTIGMVSMEDTEQRDMWIELREDQLYDNEEQTESISGILSAGMDLFSRTAAYDFGSNFFRPRSLGAEHGDVMLNGIRLNKAFKGRPEWGNWGGLNDALRQQERFAAMQTSPYGLGGMAAGINMNSNASAQRKGIKLSLARSNKNYENRIMLTYASGMMSSGWSLMFASSLRLAETGYREGTNYRAYSWFVSIDKQLGVKHRLNATFIYAMNKRGKSSPVTQEVFEMKDAAYNSYWGYQETQQRNSREKSTLEPIFQASHFYDISEKTRLHSHITVQFGSAGSNRLDYTGARILPDQRTIVGGGSNPDPAYYQKMPSYFLRDESNPDYGRAYLAQQKFEREGQINWTNLYNANLNSVGGNSIYTLYQDKRDRMFWSCLSGLSTKINEHLSIDAAISYRNDFSEHYAWMEDLLGGTGYLDVDSFEIDFVQAQSNLNTLNRIVKENEKFKYNFTLKYTNFSTYVRSVFKTKRTDAYLGIEFNSTAFYRNGLYENGAFPGNKSFGKSKQYSFHLPGIKAGITYRFTGRHLLFINGNYLYRAPFLNNAFSNVRVSNESVSGLSPSSFSGIDGKYYWRHPNFNLVMSGYYLSLKDVSKVSFYYADGISGIGETDSGNFVQEVLTGIDKKNLGLEFSLDVPIVSGLKVKAVAAVGQSVYTSNPELYVTSNAFVGQSQQGKAYLEGYRATGGPQTAFSVGFEYSSPAYWWVSTSLNLFDNSYISIAPITKTGNFFLDKDGFAIQNTDPDLVMEFLAQENLGPYLNLNVVGGKSWKINKTYLGIFIALNNLTNEIYKSGGFEQSRNANYSDFVEDKMRSKPIFGSKYWISYGATFFTSLYVRI